MSATISLTEDITACRALRRVVFINEQGVSEADIAEGLAKIGRVCVLESHRGTGLGAALIRKALDVSRGKAAQAKLGAQVHALGFYEALGFAATGPIYDDAGIPHRDMLRDL